MIGKRRSFSNGSLRRRYVQRFRPWFMNPFLSEWFSCCFVLLFHKRFGRRLAKGEKGGHPKAKIKLMFGCDFGPLSPKRWSNIHNLYVHELVLADGGSKASKRTVHDLERCVPQQAPGRIGGRRKRACSITSNDGSARDQLRHLRRLPTARANHFFKRNTCSPIFL